MRVFAVSLVLVLAAACASTPASSRPEGVATPVIDVRPPTMIFFGSGTTASAPITVTIKNVADVSLRVREIEVSSPGMTSYWLQTRRERFSQVLEPGQSHEFTVFATAETRVQSPKEPLNVRAIVTFDVNGVTFREIVHG
jgi:hypothetical protein